MVSFKYVIHGVVLNHKDNVAFN